MAETSPDDLATELAPPRIGLMSVSLYPEQGKPLVFDIDTGTGPVVDAVAFIEPNKVAGPDGRKGGKFVARVSFLVDADAPMTKRRILLIPAGKFEGGEWKGAWIAEPSARFCRTMTNPIDGSPIGVWEVGYEPDEPEQPQAKQEDFDGSAPVAVDE